MKSDSVLVSVFSCYNKNIKIFVSNQIYFDNYMKFYSSSLIIYVFFYYDITYVIFFQCYIKMII